MIVNINKENDIIKNPADYALNAFVEMRERSAVMLKEQETKGEKKPTELSTSILTLTNHFFTKACVNLVINNEDKAVLNAIERLSDIERLDENQLMTYVYRSMDTIYSSWRGLVSTVIFLKRVCNRLNELAPELSGRDETWMGFEPTIENTETMFPFVHLSKDGTFVVCLMIGENVGLVTSLTDEVVEMLLSPIEDGKFQHIDIGYIAAPVPGPKGELPNSTGAVKSLMIAELLTLWGRYPGTGNFYPGSISSALLNISNLANERISLNN